MEYKLTSKAYYDALKQSRLLGLKCKACGALSSTPRMVCRKCGSTDLETIQFKGTGKIRTFTTVYVAAEGRETECPYVLLMVELDEGPWIMGNLDGIDPTKVTMEVIGKKVKMGSKVFAGDKYSAGESARPVFSFA